MNHDQIIALMAAPIYAQMHLSSPDKESLMAQARLEAERLYSVVKYYMADHAPIESLASQA